MRGAQIRVDPDFQRLIPPLSDEETTLLRESIAAEGCREPLALWGDVLLDGHNRHALCTELGVPFETRQVPGIETRDDAEEWMFANQLGRRNLSPLAASDLRGRLFQSRKRREWSRLECQSDTIDTAAEVADEHGVSRRTVFRDAEFSGAMDVLASALGDEVRTQVLKRDGELGSLTRKDVVALAKKPAEEQREIVQRIRSGEAKNVEQAKREAKREALSSGAVKWPEGKYRVIYADPPWSYNDSRSGVEGYEASAAEGHYPTMSLDDICDLDVKSMAADDAVLFCWATFPLLPDALRVVSSWGFKYKTAFVWSKVRPNFGHYHRADAELLIVATRGSCTPEIDKREHQVQVLERDGRHSAKPEHFRELIDRLYPSGPRIELFRRGEAPRGWKVWGNESA